VAYTGTQLALLVLWGQTSVTNRTKLTTTSVSISIVGSIVLGLLSFAEHRRTIKPSLLLNAYLLLSLLFDTARTRTIWLRDGNPALSAIMTVAIATKFVLFILETIQKRNLLRPGHENTPPYATAGIINRTFFWWLNPLFLMGFSKTLTVNDLFGLDKPLVSKNIHEALNGAYSQRMLLKLSCLYLAMLIKQFSTGKIATCLILDNNQHVEMASPFGCYTTGLSNRIQRQSAFPYLGCDFNFPAAFHSRHPKSRLWSYWCLYPRIRWNCCKYHT
jgi:hypothetical protein